MTTKKSLKDLKNKYLKENKEIPPLEDGNIPKFSLVTNIKDKLINRFKKRGIWVLLIGKVNNWSLQFRQMDKEQTHFLIAGERYLINHKNILFNKGWGGLMLFYQTNPESITPKWKPCFIGNNDILITSKGVNKYMLQKIWGDFVDATSIDMMTMLKYGGIGLIVFLILKQYILG